MTRLLTALIAVSMAFAAPLMAAEDVLPSSTDEISIDRKAGAWVIFKNETRKSCFASYKSENGYVVQFGFTKDETNGYLGLFSQDAKVEEGTRDITVIANGNVYFGESTGVAVNLSDGYEGGYILVNNPNFVKDIEKGKQLVAFPDSPNTYIIDMKGAKNAVYEVRKCTTELHGS